MRLQARIYAPEDGETIELRGTTVRALCPEANSVGAFMGTVPMIGRYSDDVSDCFTRKLDRAGGA